MINKLFQSFSRYLQIRMLILLLLTPTLSVSPIIAARDLMTPVVRMQCDPESLFMRKVMRIRMDFALSDGRGNALGLRSGEPLIDLSEDERACNHYHFNWSDGRGKAISSEPTPAGNISANTSLDSVEGE